MTQSPTASRTAEQLLERINHQLKVISAEQHRLALRKIALQEGATRLRLGASPAAVRLALREAAAAPSLALFPLRSNGCPKTDEPP